MAVTTTLATKVFAGDDANTTFATGFPILDQNHLVVTLLEADGTETVQSLTTNYTVSGVGLDTTATITYPVSGSPLATGDSLRITRETPRTQSFLSIQNQSGFDADIIEAAVDRVVLLIQEALASKTAVAAVETSTSATIQGTWNFAAFTGFGAVTPGAEVHVAGASPEIRIQDITGSGYSRILGTDENGLQISADATNVDANTKIEFLIDGTLVGKFDADDFFIQNRIRHEGDINNYFLFGTDMQTWFTDGSERMSIGNSGFQLGDANATVTTILASTAAVGNSDTVMLTEAATNKRVNAADGAAKAWGYFREDGAGNVVTNATYNVTSITRSSTGRFTVNLDTDMASANYVVVGNYTFDLTSPSASNNDGQVIPSDLATGSFNLNITDGAANLRDPEGGCWFVVYGAQ